MYICLNTVDDIKTTELKSMMENQDIRGSVFKNFDGIYIWVFFVNAKGALLVAFVKYIL